MKTFRIVLLSLSIISVALLFRCDSGSTGGTGVAVANTIVSDANGVELGKAVEVNPYYITVYSPTGYMYDLDWMVISFVTECIFQLLRVGEQPIFKL